MNQDRRYLPLYNGNGKWISRPDLFVLVRMGAPDNEKESTIWETYRHMSEISDNSSIELNPLDTIIERKFVRSNMSERRYAAMVVREIARLYLNGVTPTLGKAVKLITRPLLEEQSARLESSVSEQVRKAFSRFRNTCHLEAAYRSDGPRFQTFENDPKKFDEFLSKAKALEELLDWVSAQGSLKWNPWRVPEHFTPTFKGKVTKLSVQEKALIGVA